MSLSILSPNDLAEEVGELYQKGLPPGDSTGFRNLDLFYTVAVHYWTVITGVPSHGKTTLLDNVALNLIANEWKFIMYPPEQQPLGLYMAQLCEKRTRRPFRRNYHNRLEPADIAQNMDELESSIRFLRTADDSKTFPDLHAILIAAQDVLDREQWHEHKVGIIIDPWNELDHTPIGGMNETQMINWELMLWRHWIRQHNTHGFIVAHPQKPGRDKKGNVQPVGLYDINGSAAWFNKADHGLVVRRDDDGLTTVDVEKCRFKHLGHKGSCLLKFNSGTETFDDFGNVDYGQYDDEPPEFS